MQFENRIMASVMESSLREILLDTIERHRRWGIAEQLDYDKFYLYSLVTHSTAIEGSTVTELENTLMFDKGISVKGKSIMEQMMNIDLKSAYEMAIAEAKGHTDFSVEMLRGLSAMVMKNTGAKYSTMAGEFDAAKGDLRLVNVSAGVGGRSYMNYLKVPAKLEEFCSQINERRRGLLESDDIYEKYMLSFDAHFQLVTIHPWVDGNGRMARLVMNYIQYELGVIPSKVGKEDKIEYIQALIDAREAESLEPIRRFMLTEHIKNLNEEIRGFEHSENFDPMGTNMIPREAITDGVERALYDMICEDGRRTYGEMADRIGVSESTIKRKLNRLKGGGFIQRKGGNRNGCWVIVGDKK